MVDQESGKGKSKSITVTNPDYVKFLAKKQSRRKPLAPVVVLPQLPKAGLTLEEKVDYLERMLLIQSKQITRILQVLTED